METKNSQSRGRPKKDYGELKNKLAAQAAENKGKIGRGRPKKKKNIDDSINTKIANHHKDIKVLEKKNKEIHNNIPTNIDNQNKHDKKLNSISNILLIFSISFFFISLLFFIVSIVLSKKAKNDELVFSEINNNIDYKNINNSGTALENLDINGKALLNEYIQEFENENTSQGDENIELIKIFYRYINNREFDKIYTISDKYLKNSDSFRTYFSTNRLTHFLDKIYSNKVSLTNIQEIPNEKSNVQSYLFDIKYILNSNEQLYNEQWKMDIIDRNGTKLIGSIMCITTGCSKMPFFQK